MGSLSFTVSGFVALGSSISSFLPGCWSAGFHLNDSSLGMGANTMRTLELKGARPASAQVLLPQPGCLALAAQWEFSLLVEEPLTGGPKERLFSKWWQNRHPTPGSQVIISPYDGLWTAPGACGSLSRRSLCGKFITHGLLGNGCCHG